MSLTFPAAPDASTATAPGSAASAAPALLTDRYELGMLTSFVAEGIVNKRAVFEAFTRRLPAGRRYGVVAGIGRLIPLIEAFRFDTDTIESLLDEGVIDTATAFYLRDFRFTGTVRTYREGDLFFPGSPVVQVEATLGEGLLLETLVLSILNHDCAIASAAARMSTAAGFSPASGISAARPGPTLIEMGSRRTHEHAAIAAARAAWIAGFSATSNLAAGRIWGIPTTGTAAHAFTLAHEDEMTAFAAQIAAHGVETTLLVDTYDTAEGIRNAVAAAQQAGAPGPGAIRIDSGDLAEEARKARALLDDLGATETRIVLTSDMDEYAIEALRREEVPVDGFGVGTRLVNGSGHTSAGFVYKLVAIEDGTASSGTPGTGESQENQADRPVRYRPVAKTATGKGSVGGAKRAYRIYDDAGFVTRETLHLVDHPGAHLYPVAGRPCQVIYIANGHVSPAFIGGIDGVRRARNVFQASLATLTAADLSITVGTPAAEARLASDAGTGA